MAGIRGIKLKKIKYEPGPHHKKLTGEIYMDDKKIGEILDDGWIEDVYIEFKNETVKNDFDKKVNKYYKRKNIENYSTDIYIKELIYEEKLREMVELNKKNNKRSVKKMKQISYL